MAEGESTNKRVHFNPEIDQRMLELTISENPFRDPKKWESISESLSTTFKKSISGRTCRERTIRLLKNYKTENAQSMKKSGVEEEYDEKSYLLTQIIEMEEEAALLKAQNPKRKHQDHDKNKAIEIRNAAMEGRSKHAGAAVDPELSDIEDGNSDNEDIGAINPRKRKRSASLADPALAYLRERSERDAELRREELALKKEQLQLDREKFELERIEKMRMWEMLNKK